MQINDQITNAKLVKNDNCLEFLDVSTSLYESLRELARMELMRKTEINVQTNILQKKDE